MRGYLFTALTVMMLLSLLTFSLYFYSTSFASYKTGIEKCKTSNVFDDASGDLKSIIDLKVSVNNSLKTSFAFSDRMPSRWDIPSAVSNYSVFLEEVLGSKSNSGLEFQAGSLSSNTESVDFTLHPFGFSYGYCNLSKQVLYLRNKSSQAEPERISLTVDFSGEGIEDLVWVEGEDFNLEGETVTADSDASGDEYVEDFTAMNHTINIPFEINYTLWVRTAVDDSEKNFTVEIDGKNSTRFDIRDVGSGSTTFRWYNDTLVAFNLSFGDKFVKIHPIGSSTESVDVLLLTSRYLDLSDAHNNKADDPVGYSIKETGDLGLDVEFIFYNTNYSFSTSNLARDSTSEWNFTFTDGDGVRLQAGAVDLSVEGESSMLLALDGGVNSSTAYVNTSVWFDETDDEAYFGGPANLRHKRRVGRYDTLWLARG